MFAKTTLAMQAKQCCNLGGMWCRRKDEVHRLLCCGGTEPFSVVSDDLTENLVEADGDLPVGVMGLKLGQIGYVADVITNAIRWIISVPQRESHVR